MELTPLRGRGTAANIPNRFERLVYQPDPAERDPEEPDPRTVFFRDTTRTILTKNDSPDVGFTHSVNPYRGCEHGCVYCLGGDTRVLMADGSTREIAALRPGDEIYGTTPGGWYGRYAKTTVLAQWESRKVAYRVRLEDGTELVASGDHRFLTEQGWKHVTSPAIERSRPALSLGDTLMGFGRGRPPEVLEGEPVESSEALRVVSMEPADDAVRLFDITTGTGDFIANGVVSHNCFARPTHEWLGLSAGLDFETKIFVKEDAPELLREAIASKRWNGEPIALSGVTDPYQPIERKLRITRGCLEVLAEARNPVAMITKNHLITRDTDLLAELASIGGAMVNLSITTLDHELQRVMEPRASTPARRLDAVRELTAAGIPVGVLVAPVIPGLTDHELPAILQAAADAGARSAGFVPLRLPYGLSDLFEQWLETHFPTRKEKVLHRIREIRGGKLNDPNFGSRMRGEGEYADQIRALFHVAARKAGLNQERAQLSSAHFRRPSKGGQLGLF
jgi:DNA repair photolyase